MKKPRCSICKEPCELWDRNSDGTYTCDTCLRAYAIRPIGKGEKGGNLYSGPTQEGGE